MNTKTMTKDDFAKVIENIQAMRTMDKESATIEAELTSEEIDLTLDGEPLPPMTSKQAKEYFRKLRLASQIHAEIADTLNASRQALHTLFFRPEDKFIPESNDTCDLLATMFSIVKQENK